MSLPRESSWSFMDDGYFVQGKTKKTKLKVSTIQASNNLRAKAEGADCVKSFKKKSHRCFKINKKRKYLMISKCCCNLYILSGPDSPLAPSPEQGLGLGWLPYQNRNVKQTWAPSDYLDDSSGNILSVLLIVFVHIQFFS